MALGTMLQLFVAYAGPKPATLFGDAGLGGTGRTRNVAPSSPHSSSSSDTEEDRDAKDKSVAVPSMTQQMTADVLVIDDEADVRWSVAEVLRSAGITVAEAEDGDVAFGLLSTQRYRMVLLDIRMPKRDGVSLIEAVGAVPPVIIHSAYSLDATDRQRLGTRVVGHLHKPVSPQKLLKAVEAVLDAER